MTKQKIKDQIKEHASDILQKQTTALDQLNMKKKCRF